MKISQGLLNEIGDANSCNLLTENKAKEIFNIKGELFICVLSRGNGNGQRYNLVGLCKCVHIKQFNGRPMSYFERRLLIDQGKIERSYKGQWFTWDGNTYVITSDNIYASPIEEGKQTHLF